VIIKALCHVKVKGPGGTFPRYQSSELDRDISVPHPLKVGIKAIVPFIFTTVKFDFISFLKKYFYFYSCTMSYFFFPMAQKPLVDHGLLISGASLPTLSLKHHTQ
jgi:hypothetical protein